MKTIPASSLLASRPLDAPKGPAPQKAAVNQKAWKTATDFETHFLKNALEQAFAGLAGDGPLGASGTGSDAWRSMLIDEHAKGISAKGGLGIAATVYREIIQRSGGTLNATL